MELRRMMRSRRAPRTVAAIVTMATMTVTACGNRANDVVVPVAGPGPTSEARSTPTPDFSESEPSGAATPTSSDRSASTSTSPVTTSPTDSPPPDSPPPTEPPPTTSSQATTSTSSTTTSSSSTTTTVAPPSTLALPPPPIRTLSDPFLGASNAAFDRLARANAGASMTIVRGGEIVFSRASGLTVDGQIATGDSPMVVASVSKLIVALAVARLHEQGRIDVFAPVPWGDIGLAPNPAWGDVTLRELLDHRGGLPKARYSWFTGEGTCRDHVPSLLTSPPQSHRGAWVYSNGNYCLLGLLVEQRTGLTLDQALQQLVFDPIGADGIHLTDGGLQPGDLPHPDGVERLSRLGGAGTLIVSTDDTALALGRLTLAGMWILQPPGVFTDQYGWGHTGTVDGAKACIWVLDGGETVVSATIAGNSVGAGGGVCDIVVTAIATDLGIGSARPDRTP